MCTGAYYRCGLYLCFLCAGNAAAVKERIKKEFLARLVNVAEEVAAKSGQASDVQAAANASMQDVRVNKRLQEDMDLISSLRGGAATSGSARCGDPSTSSPKDRARAELEQYLGQREEELPKMVDYPLTSSLEWWGKVGQNRFPLMAVLARALLAIKEAAGKLEQDFSLAGFMVGPKRSSLDPAYVDMTLTLKSLQPEEVPRMEQVVPLADRQGAIPQRYKDRESMDVMRDLDQPFGDDQRGVMAAMAMDMELDDYMEGAFDPINFDDALDGLLGSGSDVDEVKGQEEKEEEEPFVHEEGEWDEEQEELQLGGDDGIEVVVD